METQTSNKTSTSTFKKVLYHKQSAYKSAPDGPCLENLFSVTLKSSSFSEQHAPSFSLAGGPLMMIYSDTKDQDRNHNNPDGERIV